jgi:hypothetical protein
MEENEAIEFQKAILEEPQLTLTERSKSYLTETYKWTKFLSIFGFIMIGLLVVLGFVFVGLMSSVPYSDFVGPSRFMFAFMYIVLGAIYFIPTWSLLRYSNKMKVALAQNDQVAFEEALSNHKSFFKFFGIMTIIVLALYGFMALIGGVISIFN